jgi:hypothetical protein
MLIDLRSEELNLKIACHGPALSGKTANLGNLHTSVDPRLPGELVSLETQEDRTLFVDSLRLEAGLIRGCDPGLGPCAVPGEVIDVAPRQLVQPGAEELGWMTGSIEGSWHVCQGSGDGEFFRRVLS